MHQLGRWNHHHHHQHRNDRAAEQPWRWSKSADQCPFFQGHVNHSGIIAVPQSKVDVFILYTADGDADDSGSGYEGACVTLNSLSVLRQSKTVNGTETVTQSFSAH